MIVKKVYYYTLMIGKYSVDLRFFLNQNQHIIKFRTDIE